MTEADEAYMQNVILCIGQYPSESASAASLKMVEAELFAALDDCADLSSSELLLANILSFTRTFAAPLGINANALQFNAFDLLDAVENSRESKLYFKLHVRLLNLLLNRKTLLRSSDLEHYLMRTVEGRKRKFNGPYYLIKMYFQENPKSSVLDLDPILKLHILSNLCDWTVLECEKAREYIDSGNALLDIPNTTVDQKLFWTMSSVGQMPLRNIPLGEDNAGREYWYFCLGSARGSFSIFRSASYGHAANLEQIAMTIEDVEELVASLQVSEFKDIGDHEKLPEFSEEEKSPGMHLYEILSDHILPRMKAKHRKMLVEAQIDSRQMELRNRPVRSVRLKQQVNYAESAGIDSDPDRSEPDEEADVMEHKNESDNGSFDEHPEEDDDEFSVDEEEEEEEGNKRIFRNRKRPPVLQPQRVMTRNRDREDQKRPKYNDDDNDQFEELE